MAYTAIDDPEAYFQVVTWTGNATDDRTITLPGDTDMQPDLVWAKERSSTSGHIIVDAVRGATNFIQSHNTTAEDTNVDIVQSFETDGFEIGTHGAINEDTETYVAWCWKAGTSVSGDTTGSGTAKTYTGSVNTTSGISIINFVGNGTGGHTIPHHLGVAPRMILVKNRASGSTSWQTYHYGLDSGAGTNEIFLDLTNATNGSAGAWNNTVATSTVVTKGDGSYGNEDDSNHIMYSFADVQGYSKVGGSYVGNGNSSGSTIWCGFSPAWVMIKQSSKAGEGWHIFDNKREGYNVDNDPLVANSSNAEGTSDMIDLLSNGFKLRTTSEAVNESGETYIYMAFAEAPFVNSNGVPCNAR